MMIDDDAVGDDEQVLLRLFKLFQIYVLSERIKLFVIDQTFS